MVYNDWTKPFQQKAEKNNYTATYHAVNQRSKNVEEIKKLPQNLWICTKADELYQLIL